MPRFRLSQSDINRNKLLEPGRWYDAEVAAVTEDTMTIKGESGIARTNVDMRILDPDFEGAVVSTSFNEKYPSYVIPFLAAFGIEVEADEDYELKKLEGMRLKVFIKHREWNNKQYNDVADFRPLA